MNINWKKIGLITAATIVLFGSNVATHQYSKTKATNEVVEYLSSLCSRRAIVEAPDGSQFACMGIEQPKPQLKLTPPANSNIKEI